MNTDDLWLDTRRRLVYSNSILLAMIIMIMTFSTLLIMDISINSKNSFANTTFILWIIIPSLILLIPLKVLQGTLKNTKPIEQRIIAERILVASLSIPNGKTANDRMFDLVKRSFPSFKNSQYEGKKIKKSFEFDIFQSSPKKPFPKALWDKGDFIIGKNFQNKIITKDLLVDFFNKIKKVEHSQSTLRVFCFGENIDNVLFNEDKLNNIINEIKYPNYVSLIKDVNGKFELVNTEYLN
jgi:hypothetical protein